MVKGFVLNFHSFVDVITNSSTTIYTYSKSSIEPAKKLINSFVKLMGYSKTADEMFFIDCFPDFWEKWDDFIERTVENDFDEETESIKNMDFHERKEYFEKLKYDIASGAKERPAWIDYEPDDYYYPSSGTNIYIYPKSKKFKEVAEALVTFLYSTEHAARYEG